MDDETKQRFDKLLARVADLEAQDLANRYITLNLVFATAASQPGDPKEFLKLMFDSVSMHLDVGEPILANRPDMVAKARHSFEHMFMVAGQMLDKLPPME